MQVVSTMPRFLAGPSCTQTRWTQVRCVSLTRIAAAGKLGRVDLVGIVSVEEITGRAVS